MNFLPPASASQAIRRNWLVFTDLDASLLNEHDYSWQGAAEALRWLADHQIPVVLASSKTLAEMRPLAAELGVDTPLICENGGAIAWPDGSCQTLGTPRSTILNVLAALKTEFRFRSFDELKAPGIAELTGLTLQQASLANQRSATEPLQWLDTDEQRTAFSAAVRDAGLTLTKGGRFWHVAGNNNKAVGLQRVTAWYRERMESDIVTLAIGDSPNDVAMLQAAEYAIVVPGPDLQAKIDFCHPHKTVAPRSGSEGWGMAVLQLVASTDG